ncbi:2-iminobutanoate/2-iminopropanoate deaminase [Folsomia candida]|uniref:2-iminobutanoate/2-iminopropanoate deaminase n=1 Tax=Folsomia candida TaxID=158441 RepID=UPI000B8F5737|nr:2-iminobutanoate/2-iminopropanoate deaminase [Folsomia candida]
MGIITTTLTILFLVVFCDGNRTFIMSPELPQSGKYSHGVLVDNTLYIAGQVGMDKEGVMVAGGIENETRQALINMGHVLTAAGCSFKDVVKTTVYIQNISDATIMNQVYVEFFPQNYPARATVQIAKLHLDALVEIEGIAVLDLSSTSVASHVNMEN